jgi:CubicO group peptidase (beta-lactamase class C family)
VTRKALFGAILALLFCLFLQPRTTKPDAPPVPGQRSTATGEEPTAKVDALFAPLADTKSPGVAVLVRKDGRSVFSRGYGVRDLRSLAKIDPHTNFRLASCTKQFTAMAVMLLVHDRKLRYDDKLTDLFSDFPEYGQAITIRNLLNHTSGLPDYESLMEARARTTSLPWTEEDQIVDEDVLGLLEQTKVGLFPPGTKWAYSNSGYVVLGLVVAKVSGKRFGEFLRQRIFAPLKMDQTIAYEKHRNVVADRAFGHTQEGEGWKQTDQSPTSATLGDGGVYSSLNDLAKWDEALERHTLLSESEMLPALTPVKLADNAPPKWPAHSDRPAGTPVSYGFGWFLDPYRGHPRIWHYGETMGFRSYIERFTADKLSIIVLCNRTDLEPETLASQVASIYLN